MRKFTQQERAALHRQLDRKIDYYGEMFDTAKAKRAALAAIPAAEKEARRKKAWSDYLAGKIDKDKLREEIYKIQGTGPTTLTTARS